jgi:hypothetical protein
MWLTAEIGAYDDRSFWEIADEARLGNPWGIFQINNSGPQFRLTPKGWKRYEELKRLLLKRT